MLAVLTALTILLIASYTDIKTREVPDWLSYAAMAAGLGIAAIASLSVWSWWPLAYSVAGLVLFVAIGAALFYTGQWGGGDSKLLMGMGSIIGLTFSLERPFIAVAGSFLIAFFVNLFLVGVIYAVLWSVFMALTRKDAFAAAYAIIAGETQKAQKLTHAATALPLLAAFIVPDLFIASALVLLSFLTFITFYAMRFVRAVERGCMQRFVSPEELTEGDWIVRDVLVDGKRITGPKDLGIRKEQIALLQKLAQKGKVKKILIKEGVPFVPSFLAGFLITLQWGNVLFLTL